MSMCLGIEGLSKPLNMDGASGQGTIESSCSRGARLSRTAHDNSLQGWPMACRWGRPWSGIDLQSRFFPLSKREMGGKIPAGLKPAFFEISMEQGAWAIIAWVQKPSAQDGYCGYEEGWESSAWSWWAAVGQGVSSAVDGHFACV